MIKLTRTKIHHELVKAKPNYSWLQNGTDSWIPIAYIMFKSQSVIDSTIKRHLSNISQSIVQFVTDLQVGPTELKVYSFVCLSRIVFFNPIVRLKAQPNHV